MHDWCMTISSVNKGLFDWLTDNQLKFDYLLLLILCHDFAFYWEAPLIVVSNSGKCQGDFFTDQLNLSAPTVVVPK